METRRIRDSRLFFFQKEHSFYVYPADAELDVWLVQNLLFC